MLEPAVTYQVPFVGEEPSYAGYTSRRDCFFSSTHRSGLLQFVLPVRVHFSPVYFLRCLDVSMEAANLANLAALVLRIELLSAANYVRARHQTTCMDTSTDDVYQMRADGVHYSKRHAWARRQTKCTKCEQTMFTMSYQTTPLAEPFLLVVADEKKKTQAVPKQRWEQSSEVISFLVTVSRYQLPFFLQFPQVTNIFLQRSSDTYV